VAVFDLGAKAADVDVDGASAAVEVVAPDLAEEGLAVDDAALVGGEVAESSYSLYVRPTGGRRRGRCSWRGP
jgi:hypothetical protein